MRAATEPALPVTIVAHDVGGIGGMERQLSELIRGLLERGVEVTVVSRTCKLDDHPRLRWVRVPGPARPFVLAYPWFFFVGTVLVWRNRRGVLHTTGAIVFNRADVCTVHFSHRGVGRELGRARRTTWPYRFNSALARPLSRLAERAVYRSGLQLVAVSAGLAEELRAVGSEVVVIPNGVDADRFRPDASVRAAVRTELGVDDDGLLALFVGNEWEEKGLAIALAAVARTRNWRLVVVGDGERDRYAGLGRALFVGRRTDVERLYAAADAFVAPSAYETFSLAAHEAAASGLPLVATRVHGVDELLSDGAAGVLVERDPGAVAAALGRLEDAALRKSMGAAGRAAAERLSWSSSVDAYVRLYAS